MIGVIVPKLLIWASRLSVGLRGNRGGIPGANGSGLQLVQQSLGDDITILIGTVLFSGLLVWLIYVLAKRATAPLPFPFLGLIELIGQGMARYYQRRMINMVEPYPRQIEQALAQTQIVMRRNQDRLSGMPVVSRKEV